MEKSKISPAAIGLMVFLISVCASALMIFKGYMPYREYLRISNTCTEVAGARVLDVKQERSGTYYYGPEIEYYGAYVDQKIHTRIINTVKSKAKFKQYDEISVMYDPADLSIVLLKDDKAAYDNFTLMNTLASVVFGAGMAFLAVMVFNQFIRTRPKKYDTAPDGSTFEEWQEKQLAKTAADKDGDEEVEENGEKT